MTRRCWGDLSPLLTLPKVGSSGRSFILGGPCSSFGLGETDRLVAALGLPIRSVSKLTRFLAVKLAASESLGATGELVRIDDAGECLRADFAGDAARDGSCLGPVEASTMLLSKRRLGEGTSRLSFLVRPVARAFVWEMAKTGGVGATTCTGRFFFLADTFGVDVATCVCLGGASSFSGSSRTILGCLTSVFVGRVVRGDTLDKGSTVSR